MLPALSAPGAGGQRSGMVRYGRMLTLVDLEPRLRCAVCGGRSLFRVEP